MGYNRIILLMCILILGSNLVGKFTQSVRRIVQDVRDEGAPSESINYLESQFSLKMYTSSLFYSPPHTIPISFYCVKSKTVYVHNLAHAFFIGRNCNVNVSKLISSMCVGGQTKEEAMRTQLRLRSTRRRLEINYETAKQALVNLHNQYEKSKEVRNIFTRYNLLKAMIKVIMHLR